MKRSELYARLNRFMLGFKIRKIVLLALVALLTVFGVLGAFYYQLLLNADLGALIAWLGVIGSAVVTFISFILGSKDNYKQWLMTTYAAKMDTKQFKSTGDFVKFVEGALKDLLPNGHNGFKYACKQNKVLLKSMFASDCAAFPDYTNRGIITKLNCFFLQFSASDFKYFALMDSIHNNADNDKYRILSSTRWFQVYKRYTKAPISWAISFILPWVIWLIGSNILCSVLDGMFDFIPAILMLIQFGTFCLTFMLVRFKGKEDVLKKIAYDFVGQHEKPIVPDASFDICMAFANISAYYYNACLEAGFIQQTQPKVDEGMQAIEVVGEEQQQLLE